MPNPKIIAKHAIKENSRSDESGFLLFWELVALFALTVNSTSKHNQQKLLGTFYSHSRSMLIRMCICVWIFQHTNLYTGWLACCEKQQVGPLCWCKCKCLTIVFVWCFCVCVWVRVEEIWEGCEQDMELQTSRVRARAPYLHSSSWLLTLAQSIKSHLTSDETARRIRPKCKAWALSNLITLRLCSSRHHII